MSLAIAVMCACMASRAQAAGLWLDEAEVLALPTSGPAWTALAASALGSWGSPDIATHTNKHDVLTYAGALYAVRTGDANMRDRVIALSEWNRISAIALAVSVLPTPVGPSSKNVPIGRRPPRPAAFRRRIRAILASWFS